MLFAVKNIRASRVNLVMNSFVAGLPSPLAFLGLANFLVRSLGGTSAEWDASVLPILHNVDRAEGVTMSEDGRKDKGGVFGKTEKVEDMVGSVQVSALMDLPGCDSDTDVLRVLRGLRFAGGCIDAEAVQVESVVPDGASLLGFSRGFAMLPAGVDQKDLTVTSTGDEPSMLNIVQSLAPREGGGWRIPVAVGYRLLEDPSTATPREGTRDPNIPHVFAEPVTGIAELVSVRNRQRLVNRPLDKLQAYFWKWCYKGDDVLAHQNYHEDPQVLPTNDEVNHHG